MVIALAAWILGGIAKKPAVKELTVGKANFRVEVADTPMARVRGLSGRPSLAKSEGLLFIFPFASVQTFWMKGMNFPIDIIWIRNNRVVGWAENALPETDDDYSLYTSPEAVDVVLEINAGQVSEFGINIGDLVNF